MRRSDREIVDAEVINEIIRKCSCCRLGFYDGEEVYIVPMNFGFEIEDDKRVFYFHSAFEGRKIDLIPKVKSVCFELDTNYKLNEEDVAWEYSARFQSVIGNGKIAFVEDVPEKEKALVSLMYQNTKKEDWSFPEKVINSVCIFKVIVDSIACKEHH